MPDFAPFGGERNPLSTVEGAAMRESRGPGGASPPRPSGFPHRSPLYSKEGSSPAKSGILKMWLEAPAREAGVVAPMVPPPSGSSGEPRRRLPLRRLPGRS